MKKELDHLLMMFAFLVFMTMSCNESPIGDDFADDLYVPIGALVSVSNIQTGFFDLGDPDNSAIAFDLSSTGESLSTADIVLSYNGGDEVPFKTGVSVPGTVDVTFNEALAAAGLTSADVAVEDEFRFMFNTSTASGNHRSSNTLPVNVSCKSELAGTYDFVGSNNFCSSPDFAGTVTFTEGNAGEYTLSDWSFGSYDACYGAPAAGYGTLILKDVCNKLSVQGLDSYGDSWELIVKEVNGPDLFVTYTNTYGEFSDAVITRTDGTNWPPLTN